MDGYTTVLCYTRGEIIDCEFGVCYNRPPKKVPFPNGRGTVNYVPLPIRHDGDVSIMFTVVAQSPPPNTIEMYFQTSSINYHPMPSSFTIPMHIESLVRVDMAGVIDSIVMKVGNYVDILPENDDDNVELFDEDDGNEDIMDMEDNENTENDASLLGGGEHDVPSPIFRELNWDVINSMADKDLIAHTDLWNESDELFKGLRFESKVDLQYVVKCHSICWNQHLIVIESEPDM
ncbi:hypothetical protein AAG906_019532 [Vitis piasezkii]